jgi:hypothetical protein
MKVYKKEQPLPPIREQNVEEGKPDVGRNQGKF